MGRVLVGCERFGIVREAFLEVGHDAYSCDLAPADPPSNRHIIGDVRDHLHEGWDLLIIAHPPCTRLCRSGRRWLSGPGNMTPPKQLPRGRTWQSMKDEFAAGVDLFLACWGAPVDRVAVENPVMNDLAWAQMPSSLPKPQLVQPFQFGHPEYKETGLYLRGLPPLVETDRLPEPERGSDEWKAWNRVHRMSPSNRRGIERSRFFPGIAKAMASQWGSLI